MIDLPQAIFLALLQGLTEFLPISSSGHLVLLPSMFGWPDQGQAFDVAVHLGSLFAVVFYFRRDITELTKAIPMWLVGKHNEHTRLLCLLVIASVPVLLIGGLLHTWIAGNLRHPLIIAFTMFFFGLFLWYADSRRKEKQIVDMDLRAAWYIGISQILALVPGTSRSGITMSTAMLMGYTRQQAARFSFLLSVPVILAASGVKVFHLISLPPSSWTLFAIAVGIAFISAWIAIKVFLNIIERVGVLPFVFYRLVLAVVILIVYIM